MELSGQRHDSAALSYGESTVPPGYDDEPVWTLWGIEKIPSLPLP